ncbi:MAG: protein BatD [Tatlockia sp.]|nr:protein BatD [Tatlockia sp.]
MKLKKTLLGIFLFCCYSFVCASLSVHLDRDKVELGQTFSLILKIEGMQINAMPDFMPLENNFSIEGTQSSVNYSVINGKISSISEWTLLLTPKRSGVLAIPSLQVGNEKSDPTTIEVSEEGSTTPATTQPVSEPKSINDLQKPSGMPKQEQQDVMLLTEISVQNPLVNQQIIYTVRLYNASRLLDASYQPPQVEDALFVPMGNGRRYQVNENGRLYSVEEQQFAVFPQKTGYLKINPPSFDALLYDVRPRRISVKAKPTTLNIRPIPPEFKGKNWLPAKQVTLSEGYDKGATSLAQGSTLVRTIVVQAVALPAQLLPALDLGSSDQFSTYPEKPVESNQFQQQDLIGRSTIKITYLLNKAGKVTIPSLTLPWFNTITGKEEQSSLPELTIDVTASAASKLNKPEPAAVITPTQAPKVANPKGKAPLIPVTAPNNFAWWLAFGFALGWALTLIAWGWQRKKNGSASPTKAQILKELQQACAANKPEVARSALIQWGRLQWPKATLLNLFDLENLVDEPNLKQQINRLAQFLYQSAKPEMAWKGDDLWQAISNYKPTTGKVASENPLPPINRI